MDRPLLVRWRAGDPEPEAYASYQEALGRILVMPNGAREPTTLCVISRIVQKEVYDYLRGHASLRARMLLMMPIGESAQMRLVAEGVDGLVNREFTVHIFPNSLDYRAVPPEPTQTSSYR